MTACRSYSLITKSELVAKLVGHQIPLLPADKLILRSTADSGLSHLSKVRNAASGNIVSYTAIIFSVPCSARPKNVDGNVNE